MKKILIKCMAIGLIYGYWAILWRQAKLNVFGKMLMGQFFLFFLEKFLIFLKKYNIRKTQFKLRKKKN